MTARESAGHRSWGLRRCSPGPAPRTSRVTRSSSSSARVDGIDIADADAIDRRRRRGQARGRLPPGRRRRRRRQLGRRPARPSWPTPSARSTCSRRAAQAGAERVLAVTSADVYGRVTEDELPLDEDQPLRPVSPLRRLEGGGRRPGPAGVARPPAAGHPGAGLQPPRPGPERPLRRPVAGRPHRPQRARRRRRGAHRQHDAAARRHRRPRRGAGLPAARSTDGEPGEVYNVCRGAAVSVAARSPRRCWPWPSGRCAWCPIPALQRPVDIPVLVGDNTALRAATGWEPTIPLDTDAGRRPGRLAGPPWLLTTWPDLRRRRPDRDQESTGHRHHRSGRLAPGRAAARQGLRGARHGPAHQHGQLGAHRPPPGPHHVRARRPARPGVDPRRSSRSTSPTRSTTSPPSRSCPPRGSSRC